MAQSTISDRLIPQVQYVTPATGSTTTVNSNGCVALIFNPAGTLATATITLASSPVDLDSVTISSSQIVTALTMNGGTIIGALTAMAVATFARYTYSATAASWFRSG